MAITSRKNQKKKIEAMIDNVFVESYQSLVSKVEGMRSTAVSRSILFTASLHWKAGSQTKAINVLEQYIKACEPEQL